MQKQQVSQFVFKLKRNGNDVWLKKSGEDKRTLVNRALNAFVGRSERLSHLVLFSAYAPKVRFQHEVMALKYAASLNLPVPALLYIGRSWFVTESAGDPIIRFDGLPPRYLLSKAFDALQQMHRNAFIHGRPAMRDIVVNEQNEVTFLDLEESRASDSASLRVRDVFLFMLDSYRLTRLSQRARQQVIQSWLQQASDTEIKTFERFTRRLSQIIWIAHLARHFRRSRLTKQLILLERLLRRIDFTGAPTLPLARSCQYR